MSSKKDYTRYLQSDKWIERKNKVQEERKDGELTIFDANKWYMIKE